MPYRQPTERVTRLRLAAATEIGRMRSVNEDGGARPERRLATGSASRSRTGRAAAPRRARRCRRNRHVRLVRRGAWQCAQVGDTRAYRLREGFFEKLTPEEARDFPHRNVITRAIGVTEKVEPDFGSFEVERGDRLLLCSDGLWGELDDRTIARLLHDHPEPEEACGALLDAANRAGGRDNITALVANVG